MQAWGNFFSMKPYSGKFSILFLPCLLPWGADLRRLTSINSLAFNFLLGLANGRQWQVGEKMKVILECIPLLSSLLANSGWQCPSMKGHSSCHMTLSILLQAHLILSCFTLLCFADTTVFYKVKVWGNPSSGKSIITVFPTAFTHFVSLVHILVIVTIYKTFYYYCICYGDLWSGIFDVTFVIVLSTLTMLI